MHIAFWTTMFFYYGYVRLGWTSDRFQADSLVIYTAISVSL
ncbi:MAG: hypothetical protein BACD_02271 [Bacteroides rodentium]